MNLVKYPQLEVAFSMGFLFGRSHQLSFLLHVPAPKRLCHSFYLHRLVRRHDTKTASHLLMIQWDRTNKVVFPKQMTFSCKTNDLAADNISDYQNVKFFVNFFVGHVPKRIPMQ
jgi:hypothetical protein